MGEVLGGVESRRNASLLRVAIASILLVAAPIAVGYLSVVATDGEGWNVEGFGAFVAISLLWVAAGAILIRALRVRSLWLGVLFTIAPALTSFVARESGLGGIIAIGLGILASALGTRGKGMLSVPPRGRVVMLIVALLAALPIVAVAQGSPEQALRSSFNDQILGRYEASRSEVFMLVPSNSFTGKRGRRLHLVHAELVGRHWTLTPPVQDTADQLNTGDFTVTDRDADFLGFGDRDSPALGVPEACVRPAVRVVPAVEIEGNCWLPQLGLLAGVAPGRSRILELTMRDGTVTRNTLKRVKGFGPGFVLPYFRRGIELPASSQPVRLAFRDASGELLDARPAMRFAAPWYQSIGTLFRIEICRAGGRQTYGCPGTDKYRPRDRVYAIMVSLSLLRPEEYRVKCSQEPPRGDWVALAHVDLRPEHIVLDWDAGRSFTGDSLRGNTVRHVAVGVRIVGNEPDQWLDLASARIGGSPCFPGTTSDPDLYGSD